MLTNCRTIRIEWGDCDAAGIVYYPRYFEWFDACTHALFEHAGLPMPALLTDRGIAGIPMVDTRARFIQSSAFGEDVVIESRVTRWGRSSFDVHHRLLRAGVLAVEGYETRVWTIRQQDGRLKGTPVPDDVRRRLTGETA